MPTYEYECDACGHRLELFQKMDDYEGIVYDRMLSLINVIVQELESVKDAPAGRVHRHPMAMIC